MTVSTNWQFEMDGVQFGEGTDILVYEFDHPGPTARKNDASIPRGHGRRFGRTYLDGCVVTLEMEVDEASATTSLETLGALRKVWYGLEVISEPAAVTYLSYLRPGRGACRIYGRPDPEKFTVSSLENVGVGHVGVTAEFETADHRIYSDAEFTHTIGIVPGTTGGVSAPVSAPVHTTATGEASDDVVIGGDDATWLVCTITGPIVNPVIDVLNFWQCKLLATLESGQSVTIDPRPWARTILRNDGASLAGSFSSSSPRLSGMAVNPGTHEIVLRGTSSTGTASLSVAYRNAYLSL